MGLSEAERAERIRGLIRSGEREVLARHPFLANRDAVGAGLFVISLGGMVGLAWLYAVGRVPGYVALLGNAFFASILHEIEHDLIHRLYFPRGGLVPNAMMLLVWMARGNVPNGWYRRRIHLHHHRASGSATDVEERLLGLGTPWGPKRFLGSVDSFLAFLVNARPLSRELPGFSRFRLALAAFPVYPVFLSVLFGYLVMQVAAAAGVSTPLAAFEPALTVLAVCWVFPNVVRQASLHVISSNVHYYGDVRSLNEETQVLRPFWLWPLQLFCFNFGATHSFHHYVVDQPFYLRQLAAPFVLPHLSALGVRVNDIGTFERANRFRR